MRCKNCGWENPAGNTKCEKCNASLKGATTDEDESVPRPAPGNLNKTVFEGSAQEGAGAANESNVCPQCGYPIRKNETSCPQCDYSFVDIKFTERESAYKDVPKDIKKTVSPWEVSSMPSCTLTMIPANEKETINSPVVSLTGETIILNRDNTERNNQTITSKEQAELTFENDKWYICDKSSMQSTYMYVGTEKRELKPGDIIMLGNRRFEFKG